VLTHPTHPLPTGLGISVGSAVLVQLTVVSVRHRDHATFVAIGRIFAVRVYGSDAALNYLSVCVTDVRCSDDERSPGCQCGAEPSVVPEQYVRHHW